VKGDVGVFVEPKGFDAAGFGAPKGFEAAGAEDVVSIALLEKGAALLGADAEPKGFAWAGCC
jgi:hypothetical protein